MRGEEEEEKEGGKEDGREEEGSKVHEALIVRVLVISDESQFLLCT